MGSNPDFATSQFVTSDKSLSTPVPSFLISKVQIIIVTTLTELLKGLNELIFTEWWGYWLACGWVLYIY